MCAVLHSSIWCTPGYINSKNKIKLFKMWPTCAFMTAWDWVNTGAFCFVHISPTGLYHSLDNPKNKVRAAIINLLRTLYSKRLIASNLRTKFPVMHGLRAPLFWDTRARTTERQLTPATILYSSLSFLKPVKNPK